MFMEVRKVNNKDEQKQKKERRNNRLNLRVSDAELSGINMVSFNDDEPVSQVIRKAIKMYVNLRKNTY